jgi:3-oxoacyl-[acyl-carrier protein] reductase
MRLQDKVAVVTGAGRGIGRAIAVAYASQGARVVVSDRDQDAAGETARGIAAQGGAVVAVRADVAIESDVDALMASTIGRFGIPDILVSNAGIGFHRALLDLGLDDWERVLRVNLTGTFLCVQRAARAMSERRSGSIIVIGSTSGQRGAAARSAYGASKAGVMQLMRIAAVELGPLGVRVNAIAPGPITTPLSSSRHTDEQRRAYLERIPMGRYGEAPEVAAAALFLASPESSYITGHVLNVDGGMNEAGLMFDLSRIRTHA